MEAPHYDQPAINPELRALQDQAEKDRVDAINSQVTQDTRSLTARYGELTDYDTAQVLARYGSRLAMSGLSPGISPLLVNAR